MKSTTFRLAALLLGIAGVLATVLLYGPLWVSIGAGVLFGAGGWLVDNFSGFRGLGGQLSSWALAAGGGIVGLAWHLNYSFEAASTHAIFPSAIQYLAVVLCCWGALMYVARLHPVRPNKSLKRTREG